MSTMTPRMAKMWLEAQKAEGIDVDGKKMEAIDAGITALCKSVKAVSVPLHEPITRKVTYTKSCPHCCRLLCEKANFCDNCGQAITS